MSTLTLTANIRPAETDGKPYLLVETKCIERPDLDTRYGIGIKINQRALAERLVRAINAGKAFTNVRVAKDVHNNEYISCDCVVYTRFLNAELRRLGF